MLHIFLNRPNENVKLAAARDYVTFSTAAKATATEAETATATANTEAAWTTEWIMSAWKCQNNSSRSLSRGRGSRRQTRRISARCMPHNFCMRHFQWRNCGKRPRKTRTDVQWARNPILRNLINNFRWMTYRTQIHWSVIDTIYSFNLIWIKCRQIGFLAHCETFLVRECLVCVHEWPRICVWVFMCVSAM